MFKDPFGWFPTPFFSSALALLFLSAFALDYALPLLTARDRASKPVLRKDRWSYQAVQAAGLLSVVASVGLRNLRWGIAPVAVQYLGLVLIPIGLVLRLWAIARLGRFFSRVVEIETGHRLVTGGLRMAGLSGIPSTPSGTPSSASRTPGPPVQARCRTSAFCPATSS